MRPQSPVKVATDRVEVVTPVFTIDLQRIVKLDGVAKGGHTGRISRNVFGLIQVKCLQHLFSFCFPRKFWVCR